MRPRFDYGWELHSVRAIKQQQIIANKAGDRVVYYPNWLKVDEAQQFLEEVQATTPFERKEIIIHGRKVMQPRLISWHGDPGKAYTYSGLTVIPKPWTPPLIAVKDRLQDFLKIRFNSVLLNLYETGRHSVGWHSDNETGLGPTPDDICIACLSLGQVRTFELRRKGSEEVEQLDLVPGSLIVMSGTTQRNWMHRVPKCSSRNLRPRISLTYRVVT